MLPNLLVAQKPQISYYAPHSQGSRFTQHGADVQTGEISEILKGAEGAIHELRNARVYGENHPWQFAVEIGQLNAMGLSYSDLRILVRAGYLQHAREVTTGDSPKREFKPIASLSFSAASCFVLTDEGNFVCQGVFEALPCWDVEKRELRVAQALVKRFRCPALNQEAVLCVFQEDGWPNRIDDPLPPSPDQEPKRRLHDTIKSLNRNQINQLIRFHGDGTGQGVTWELLRPATSSNHTQASPSLPHVACSNNVAAGYNKSHQEGRAMRKEG